MAKRVADSQINKDNAGISDDDEPRPQTMASAEVMAKRKILRPKKRSFTPTSSAFSGFGGSLSVALGKPNDSDNSDNSEMLKALGNKFVTAVTTAAGVAGVADFRQICEKYLEFRRKIDDGSIGGAESVGTGSLSVASVGNNDLALGSLASHQFTPSVAASSAGTSTGATGFKGIFSTAASTSSSSGRTTTSDTSATTTTPFGAASSAPSVPSNPFSGISFNQSKSAAEAPALAPKNPFANVSMSKPVDLQLPKEKPAPKPEPISLDSDSESEDEKPKEIKIAGPSFSLASKPTIKNSPFSFNKKPQAKDPDSDLDSEIEIKGPTFTFNKKIQDPVFTLKQAETTKEIPKETAKESNLEPAAKPTPFSFTAQTDKKETSASSAAPPAFSFGSSTFGSSTGSNAVASKQPEPFSFGSSTNAKTPAFSFTANTAPSSNTASSTSAATPFSFGNSLSGDSKPSVLFGTQGSGSDTKPAFLFGSTETKSAPFLFGNNTEKPAFTFGSGSSAGTFGAKSTQASFGQTLSKQAPFGQAQPSVTKPASNGDESNEAEEEADIKFAPVASLGEKQVDTSSGEENETVALQQRAKLMLFDAANKAEPYKNMGVGELKVLSSNDGKSARALLRADGALRVLLNVALKKELSYETMGNGSLVRVPAVDADGKITTYVLKVKTTEDGKNLAKVMSECKK